MRWGSVSLVLRRVFPGLPKLQRYDAIDRQPAQRKWASFMCATVQRLPLFLSLQPPLHLPVLHRCVQDAQLTFSFEHHPLRPQQCLAFAALASFGHPQMQLSYIFSGPDLDQPALANRRRLFDIVVLLHTSLFPCESVGCPSGVCLWPCSVARGNPRPRFDHVLALAVRVLALANFSHCGPWLSVCLHCGPWLSACLHCRPRLSVCLHWPTSDTVFINNTRHSCSGAELQWVSTQHANAA
jgi:hypothetical protein